MFCKETVMRSLCVFCLFHMLNGVLKSLKRVSEHYNISIIFKTKQILESHLRKTKPIEDKI